MGQSFVNEHMLKQVAGVTNGDTHDHSGGDGAQIDHGGLAGLADDDHTQYLTEARHGGVHAVLKAYRSTNQSISAATNTTVAFDTILIEDDIDDDVDINTGTGVITINTTGLYVVTFNARWAAGATQHHAWILHGAQEVARQTVVMDVTGVRVNHSVNVLISATATDTVTCQVWQNSGGTKNLIGAQETSVSIHRLK